MILRGARCLTLDPARPAIRADVRIDPAGRIEALLPPGRSVPPSEKDVDLTGRILMPGLVQTHVHLCQVAMRGLAERLPLDRWLRERIWPLEAAHDEATLAASARLGLAELLSGGTTAILDMGTTRRQEAILASCEESGIRALSGLALMDEGDGIPRALGRDAEDALVETFALARRYPGEPHGRVGLCLCPRFLGSVSDRAWSRVASASADRGLLIHTHLAETRAEVAADRARTGTTALAHLERLGVAGARLRAAHGVWLDADDLAILRRTGGMLVHCPGSNAKLGSGVADVLSWEGIPAGIGCDGAPCNNRLDAWEEMRRAAHAMALLHGPEAIDPARILAMATIDGARLLGLEERIGSIVPGKEADLVSLEPRLEPALEPPAGDLYAQVLYGASRAAVDSVWISGRVVARRGVPLTLPLGRVRREAARAATILLERVETGRRR
ncbi:MAG: amidohydrolase family protein [Candidatus Eisenbacteria bacterium]